MIVVVGDGLVYAAAGLGPDGARAGEGEADRSDRHVAGRTAAIASAAAGAGADVEVVGKVGEDEAGDAIVLGLAREGIGHVALLRDPASPTPVGRLEQAQETDDLGGEGELAAAIADPREATTEPGSGTAEPDAGTSEPATGTGEPAKGGSSPRRADEPGPSTAPIGPALEPADLELALGYLSSIGVIVTATTLADAALAVIAEAAAYNGAQLVVVTEAGKGQALIEGATVLEAPVDDPDDRFAALVGRYAAGLDGGLDPATAFRSASEALGWEAAAPA